MKWFNFSRQQLVRLVVTLVFLVAAMGALYALWLHYEYDPWTRDARIKADVVQVAPDVSGQVVRVLVKDNQTVRQGDILFEIDRERFELALRQAQATEEAARVTLAQAKREARRNVRLGSLVAREVREQGHSRVDQARADLAMAIVARDKARLDFRRSRVLATVNGHITNLNVHVGTYVTASNPALAVIDSDSLYVEGYFEETKLPQIKPGDPVSISLMGEEEKLTGRVQSVAIGIFDRERSTGTNLLQNINPTLNWVRLVQRIPVRVSLDAVPPHIRLVVGQTATLNVHVSRERKRVGAEAAK